MKKIVIFLFLLTIFSCSVSKKDCCKITNSVIPKKDKKLLMLIEIAEQLDREGLSPVYLGIPVVESNLDPYAVSRDGSAGLWQLQPRTAKAFKLKVSPQLDERLCPKKSTQAAIKFIKYLKSQFGSDEFTIAGYQLGETKLRRILKRKKDLPEISRKYVLNVKNAYNKWKAVIDPLRQSQPMAG